MKSIINQPSSYGGVPSIYGKPHQLMLGSFPAARPWHLPLPLPLGQSDSPHRRRRSGHWPGCPGCILGSVERFLAKFNGDEWWLKYGDFMRYSWWWYMDFEMYVDMFHNGVYLQSTYLVRKVTSSEKSSSLGTPSPDEESLQLCMYSTVSP